MQLVWVNLLPAAMENLRNQFKQTPKETKVCFYQKHHVPLDNQGNGTC